MQIEVRLVACEADKALPLTVPNSLTIVLDCVEKVIVCCQFVLLCISRVRASFTGVSRAIFEILILSFHLVPV